MAALQAFMVEVLRKRKAAAHRKQASPGARVWTRRGGRGLRGGRVLFGWPRLVCAPTPSHSSRVQAAMVDELEAEVAAMLAAQEKEMQQAQQVRQQPRGKARVMPVPIHLPAC